MSAVHTDGNRTGRGWSNQLWNNCPWREINDNPGLGLTWFEDFLNVDAGAWTVTNATSGTLAPIAGVGGIGQFSAGAATDTQGVLDANPGDSVGGYITLSAATTFWYEALVRPTNLAHGFMLGLATHGEGLANTGEPNGTDRIHFNNDDAASLLFNFKDASGSEYEVDTGFDFTSAAWCKLGFRVNGLKSVTYFVNSVAIATFAATSTYPLPDAVMAPVFACVANGSTTPTLDVDWVRLALLDERYSIVTV